MRSLAVVAACVALAAGCGRQGPTQPAALSPADAAFQKLLQEQFLDAKRGTVIEIPPGKHALNRVLTLRADARLGWTSGGRAPVTVAVYGNNLFDKQYATGINNISATTLGTPFTDITAPRFWGVELGIRY